MAATHSPSARPINVEVVLLPRSLRPEHVAGRSVVVFDVLRATTTMAAALEAGVEAIRVFDHLDAARNAAAAWTGPGPKLLCGEHRCLPPPDFDLGNSPGAFTPARHRGQTLFMSTTNGTRAIVAARGAALLLVGAVVNRLIVARLLAEAGRDVTLLCAGTDGAVALEDVLGAGAVLDALQGQTPVHLSSDAAELALATFAACRDRLYETFTQTPGGRNVINVGLEQDVRFAARLDALASVGAVHLLDDKQLVVTRIARV